MLNGRVICLGVLCILFITSTVFAQSQSATDTIIEKIGESERRIHDHVDTKVKEVETKIETLSPTVGVLSTDVAVNKTNIGNIKESIRDLKGTVDRIWYGILGVFGTLILYFVKSWWENRGKKDDVDAVDRLTEQITNLTSAQAETSAQITKLISVQTEISATRVVSGDPKALSVQRLDKLTDDIRSPRHDVGETI